MEELPFDSPRIDSAVFSAAELKWAPVVLLGPILPAVLSVLVISVGHVILLTDPINASATFYCGYPIDSFLAAAIGNSYIFLFVFAWTFLGCESDIIIGGKRHTLLRPFRRLMTVAMAYAVPFAMSVVVFIYGTWALSAGALTCPSENPQLYGFTKFMAVAYWLGLGVAAVHVVQIAFAGELAKGASGLGRFVKDARMSPEAAAKQHETKVLEAKFKEHDARGRGRLDMDEFTAMTTDLGMELSPGELKTAFNKMDIAGEGAITLQPFLQWYAVAMADDSLSRRNDEGSSGGGGGGGGGGKDGGHG